MSRSSTNRPTGPRSKDISFHVSRGETIAFVGPSGSGKTTLVKLLVGLYRPQSGHIYYNGTREDEIDIDGLRERIGFVTQDSQLFSGSIRENLLFVRPEATDAECMDVLRQASVDSLLARADRGLDTVIGEGGVKVSGGEKQRLSIARALLRKPQLMVFDEATSSLDSLTEEEISQTIRDVADQPGCNYDSDRASFVDRAARRSDLRSGAGTDRRVRETRRADRSERSVLRDVAAAGWRRPRRTGGGELKRQCGRAGDSARVSENVFLGYFWIITSVDLITTTTVSPTFRFSWSALLRVITLSISFSPT